MKITLITPAPAGPRSGNVLTALRYARLLRQLGHDVVVNQEDEACDLLIALHARRSYPAIQRFRNEHATLPLIVVLTGTDLYRDIRTSAKARRSIDLATRVVVLQRNAPEHLPRPIRPKTRVIFQSAETARGKAQP